MPDSLEASSPSFVSRASHADRGSRTRCCSPADARLRPSLSEAGATRAADGTLPHAPMPQARPSFGSHSHGSAQAAQGAGAQPSSSPSGGAQDASPGSPMRGASPMGPSRLSSVVSHVGVPPLTPAAVVSTSQHSGAAAPASAGPSEATPGTVVLHHSGPNSPISVPSVSPQPFGALTPSLRAAAPEYEAVGVRPVAATPAAPAAWAAQAGPQTATPEDALARSGSGGGTGEGAGWTDNPAFRMGSAQSASTVSDLPSRRDPGSIRGSGDVQPQPPQPQPPQPLAVVTQGPHNARYDAGPLSGASFVTSAAGRSRGPSAEDAGTGADASPGSPRLASGPSGVLASLMSPSSQPLRSTVVAAAMAGGLVRRRSSNLTLRPVPKRRLTASNLQPHQEEQRPVGGADEAPASWQTGLPHSGSSRAQTGAAPDAPAPSSPRRRITWHDRAGRNDERELGSDAPGTAAGATARPGPVSGSRVLFRRRSMQGSRLASTASRASLAPGELAVIREGRRTGSAEAFSSPRDKSRSHSHGGSLAAAAAAALEGSTGSPPGAAGSPAHIDTGSTAGVLLTSGGHAALSFPTQPPASQRQHSAAARTSLTSRATSDRSGTLGQRAARRSATGGRASMERMLSDGVTTGDSAAPPQPRLSSLRTSGRRILSRRSIVGSQPSYRRIAPGVDAARLDRAVNTDGSPLVKVQSALNAVPSMARQLRERVVVGGRDVSGSAGGAVRRGRLAATHVNRGRDTMARWRLLCLLCVGRPHALLPGLYGLQVAGVVLQGGTRVGGVIVQGGQQVPSHALPCGGQAPG